MSSIHGHEVLNMMHNQRYTEASLVQAIKEKFGDNAQFHTCSAQAMSAEELVVFLKNKRKFMPVEEGNFTVDTDKICNH